MRPFSFSSAVGSSFAALSVCIMATALSASEVQWSRDIDESLRQSAATGKPILMEFTAKWCAFCRKMEVTTFSDPKVSARIHQQFIPVQVDADLHKDLVKQLQIKGLPAILVVGPDLEIIERISGYQTADALMARLDKVALPASQPVAEQTVVATKERAPKNRPAAKPARKPATENPFSDFEQAIAASTESEEPSEEVAVADASADMNTEEAATEDTIVEEPAARTRAKSSDNPFAAFEESTSKDTKVAGGRRQISFEEESAPIRSASQSREPEAGESAAAEEEAQEDARSWEVPSEQPAKTAAKPATTRAAVTRPAAAKPAAAKSKAPSFGGLCLVSAVDERTLTEGSPEFQTTYRGKQVQFCSDEHKQKFLANPEQYWPMLDGACAVTLAEEGETVPGEVRYASVFRKRVWLFASEAKMKTFIAAPADIVEEALE